MKTSDESEVSTVDNPSELTKHELMSMFWRSFTINASFNYERQMSQGFAYSMRM